MNRAEAWLRARRADLSLAALALLFALPTLSYKYGFDQALFHYVGAGWLEGRVPYLHAFDVKPPGIFALYALAIATLGRAQSSIHVFEAACLIATGFLATRGATGDRARPPGLGGATALLLTSWYVSRFGFWDTAQAELWEAAFVVGAYAALREGAAPYRVLGAGALAGVAILFKLTAVLPATALFVIAALRPLADPSPARFRHVRTAAAAFVAGVLGPLTVTALYFAARGATTAVVEWARYVVHYASMPTDTEWSLVFGPELLIAGTGLFVALMLGLAVFDWTEARRDGDRKARRRSLERGMLLLATALSVGVQRKFLSYHASVLGPLLVLVAAPGLARLVAERRGAAFAAVVLVAFGTFLDAPVWFAGTLTSTRFFAFHVLVPSLLGRTDPGAVSRAFAGPFGYSYPAHEALAAVVRARVPRPGDTLQVRGFDPTAYVLTGLHSPSRFMSEAPLDAFLVQANPGWADEHRRVLREHPPRFFVSHVGTAGEPGELEELGYRRVAVRENLVLYDRDGGDRPVLRDEFERLFASAHVTGTLARQLPFELTLADGGALTALVGGRRDDGTVEFLSHDRFCVRVQAWLDGKRTCVTLSERHGTFTAFDAEGRDVAEFRLLR